MTYVKLEEKDQLAWITIDRPKALNALNREVLQELDQCFDRVDQAKSRVVILTGGGQKAFVAGADIGEMKDMTPEEAKAFGEFGNRVFRKIDCFPLPVIAAVNGFALGGGNELAMSCDIRYASENAVFGQPEVGLGITPGFGGTQRLARLTGSLSKAKEILYTARNIKAQEALELGLVSAVLPQEDLLTAVEKLAKRIAANAPIAVRQTKKAVNEGLEGSLKEGIALEPQLFSECFATEDQKEGMTAFLEKRKEKDFHNR